MQFDFSRLRGRITEKFGNGAKLARAIGKKPGWLSTRLSGLVPFRADDIVLLSDPEVLDIDPAEISSYFFTPKVR